MDFHEIPFSEIEAQIMIEIGTWKNFDEIEECLILDELMLLVQSLNKKQRNHFRLLAASQGYELPEEDDSMEDMGDDDLPPEIIEAERALKARKAKELGPKKQELATQSGLGLGYQAVTDKIIDQSVL